MGRVPRSSANLSPSLCNGSVLRESKQNNAVSVPTQRSTLDAVGRTVVCSGSFLLLYNPPCTLQDIANYFVLRIPSPEIIELSNWNNPVTNASKALLFSLEGLFAGEFDIHSLRL